MHFEGACIVAVLPGCNFESNRGEGSCSYNYCLWGTIAVVTSRESRQQGNERLKAYSGCNLYIFCNRMKRWKIQDSWVNKAGFLKYEFMLRGFDSNVIENFRMCSCNKQPGRNANPKHPNCIATGWTVYHAFLPLCQVYWLTRFFYNKVISFSRVLQFKAEPFRQPWKKKLEQRAL